MKRTTQFSTRAAAKPATPRTAGPTPWEALSRKIEGVRSEVRALAPVAPDPKPVSWDMQLGVILQELAAACNPVPSAEGRAARKYLVRAPTGGGEVDPSAGGFLVETEFAADLVALAYEQTELAQRCMRYTTERRLSDVRLPGIDEKSRADGSRWGGAISYWIAEGTTIPASFPTWRSVAFAAKKVAAAITVTNELLADAPMLGQHMSRVLTAELGFQLDRTIITGTGAGTPLGIVNASGTISIAKEVGQASKTIVQENIQKMWSALPAPSRKNAIWCVSDQLEEQLDAMGTISASSTALYFPNATNGPTLKGRPVIQVEQCPSAGSPGDIVLADMAHYAIVDNRIAPMLSAHVSFASDQAVFRFVLRIDGRPTFITPVTPFNGTGTRSPFVILAAR